MSTQWRVTNAIEHLIKHARSASTGLCARYTRQAIEAGGVKLVPHASAKDYGSSLLLAGFSELAYCPAQHNAGDVTVIQPIKNHPHGHMAMYDGTRWISDFIQRTMYPGATYRTIKPAYSIYRHPDAAGK